jgi:hypothetical protein
MGIGMQVVGDLPYCRKDDLNSDVLPSRPKLMIAGSRVVPIAMSTMLP